MEKKSEKARCELADGEGAWRRRAQRGRLEDVLSYTGANAAQLKVLLGESIDARHPGLGGEEAYAPPTASRRRRAYRRRLARAWRSRRRRPFSDYVGVATIWQPS